MAPDGGSRYSKDMGSPTKTLMQTAALAAFLALQSGVLFAQAAGTPPADPATTTTPATQATPDATAATLPATPDPGTGGAPAEATQGFLGWLASPQAYRPEMGLLFIANLDPDAGTASTHLITNNAGISLEYAVDGKGLVTFEPYLGFYGNYYTLSDSGKAVPCGAELRDVYMIGLTLDTPFFFNFRLGQKLRFSAGAGLLFHLRVGIKAADDIGIQGDTSDDTRSSRPSTPITGPWPVSSCLPPRCASSTP